MPILSGKSVSVILLVYVLMDQLDHALESSSSDLFYDAASSLSDDQDETSEDEKDSLPGSLASSPTNGDKKDSDDSGSENDLDIDPLSLDSGNQIFDHLRGSFQQGHHQTSLQSSQLAVPRSCYNGYQPPYPICNEKVAVQELRNLHKRRVASQSPDGDDFEEIELSDFVVYLPPDNKHHPCEMRGLQHLAIKRGHGSFYFDGVLCLGNTRRYVQGVPFQYCPIGNYGVDIHEVGTEIWIQSDLNEKSDLFYRLANPSIEYVRFHEGFLWLANLAKHVVDFLESFENVSIHHFRSDFHTWLQQTHGASPAFHNWFRHWNREDFRRHVAANIEFLFKESIGVNERLRAQPIWSEIMERDSIPQQIIQERKTVVTPYVYECFKDIKFAHHLLPIEPSIMSKMHQTIQGEALNLTSPTSRPHPSPASRIAVEIPDASTRLHIIRKKIRDVKIGDVLSVVKDGKGSVWKDESSRWNAANSSWYIYVQGIHEAKNGQKSFDGIWLYSPADTMCGLMKYPWPNELFFSDNCTCSQRKIKEDEIIDVVTILWHSNPLEAGRRLFVRQTYLENERFVTLKEAHKLCVHTPTPIDLKKYPIGQAVLVAPSSRTRYELEPYEIIRYITEGTQHFAEMSRLQRRQEIDGKGKPNELVYTNVHIEKFKVEELQRTCLVRLYKQLDVEKSRIPAPYSRDGTGNAFYITTRLIQIDGSLKLIPIEADPPQSLIQGFDPLSAPPKKLLRGMDLYCGGGNFGRGLEEGGALFNEWAVDINRDAIHVSCSHFS